MWSDTQDPADLILLTYLRLVSAAWKMSPSCPLGGTKGKPLSTWQRGLGICTPAFTSNPVTEQTAGGGGL